MPANSHAMPAQHGALLRSQKRFVLLKRSIDAVPGVGALAVAVRDPIEAVENSSMMRRMDLRIIQQAIGDDPLSVRRINVMENFIGPNSARRGGFVEPFVVIGHDRALAEQEVRMV